MAELFWSDVRWQGRVRPRFSWEGFLVVLLGVAILAALSPTVARAQQEEFKHAVELTQAGKLHEAELAWRELARTHPTNAEVHSGLGVVLAQQGNLQDAVAEYRRALTLNPKLKGISFNLGLDEFKQGHFAAAIKPLIAAATEDPQDKRSGLLIGMSYFGLHHYVKATPYLQTASASEPSNIELHTVLAQSCLWSAQYTCAMAEYKAILSADPDSVQAHMLLGQALDSLNKHSEAIAELETAARIAPTEPNVHFELGYLYYTAHDYEHAEPQFELELKNNPDNAQALTYLADIKIRGNDDAAAEALLTKAIHLQTNIRLAYLDLGIVYSNQKKNQEAIKPLLRAEELDPKEPDAHYRLGRVYMAQGDKLKADREFAKTKELHHKTTESLIQKVTGSGDGSPVTP